MSSLPTPLPANASQNATPHFPAETGLPLALDTEANPPTHVDQRLARKRLLSRDRARKYREKQRNVRPPKEKRSAEEKKKKNRFAQQEHRQREATWASYPPAFRTLFESSPAAVLKLKRASYVERAGRSDRVSWATGSPKLIPLRECLGTEAPTSDALWDEITRNIDARQRVTVVANTNDGTQTMKQMEWNTVVSTLLKEIGRSAESKSEFSAIFGLPLAAEEIQLALPARLGRTMITPDLAKEHTANIGFANQVVNFHIDTGYAGLAALAGDCEKIWLVAPPVEANLQLLAGEDQTLPHLVANLTKLAVIRQTSSEGMFLPPGVIHATFTVKTGILYGNNFRTRQNIFGATMGLAYTLREPDEEDPWRERDRIVKTWIDVMRDIAEHGNDKEKGEALYSFRLELMRGLRREGAFQHWSVEIEELAKACYPKAKLREKQPRGL